MIDDYMIRFGRLARRQVFSIESLARHEETSIQKAAIVCWTKSAMENIGLLFSVSTFKNVLQFIQSGRASSSSIIGGVKKLRALQWCLVEAKRSMHLEFFLKDASSISLSCDKRHPFRVAIPRI
eukprot:10687117-Lingulodinium_polyedra.AAC.1